MTVIQTKYFPGRFGLGTEFALSNLPIDYSRVFVNRFINLKGDAEKRQGLLQLGNTVSGAPTMTGLHEYVDKLGVSTIFGSANGTIYKLDETAGTWTQVLTGKDPAQRLLSVQMAGKLIFVNGSDRNFYTDDGGVTFKELRSIIVRGVGSSTSTSAAGLSDANITSFRTDTFVVNNDLVHNITLGAYGIVTSVGASLSHSPIGSAATGIGHPVAGSANQAPGDIYQIIDLIESNIIPVGEDFDNFATLTGSSSAQGIYVSGINFLNTEVEIGDIIYNTTRNAVTQVSAVATAFLTVKGVAGQTANDSVTFHKSAMPLSTWAHVHYGRLYLIDARNRSIVRISGPDDPQDFTTFQSALNASLQDYGSRQPQAETLLTLKTFQKYLVAGGLRNVYADDGIDPVQDTSAAVTDFQPVGLFPQGSVSRFGLESIGGAMIFAANDGLRNFTATFDSQTFQTANISEAIKTEISAAIQDLFSVPDEIQCIHYPRRNWLLFKAGDVIYNYNYSPSYNAGQILSNPYGSFSKFTGKFAEQEVYLVRRNGDLICAGAGGKVYSFDMGNYDDAGQNITAIMESAFLKLNEVQESTQMKSGTYIKPIFESSLPITYNIEAVARFDQTSTDTASVITKGVGEVGFSVVGSSPIGGSRVFEEKLGLRWRGEEVRIRITTDSMAGPDIITGFTLYGNVLGKT